MPKTSTPKRSEAITVSGQAAINLLSAWQGIVKLFGGECETWEVNSDGVIANGFSVRAPYDPNQILTDISHQNRRADFLPAYNMIMGNAPAEMTASDVTAFLVQFYKGSVEDGTTRTPAYARSAASEYKTSQGINTKKGRPRKTLRLDDLESVSTSDLEKVDPEQLQHLAALVNAVIGNPVQG